MPMAEDWKVIVDTFPMDTRTKGKHWIYWERQSLEPGQPQEQLRSSF